MNNSNESFLDIIEEAKDGRLQLPKFQREFKWTTNQVKSLYDSLRKDYPVGSMLLLSSDAEVDFEPRAYEGIHIKKDQSLRRLTLDGQQRITAGLILIYGTGSTKYFLDIRQLQAMIEEKNIDLNDPERIREFCLDFDETDGYIVSQRKKKIDYPKLLHQDDLLFLGYLKDNHTFTQAINNYMNIDNRDLLLNVVLTNFVMQKSIQIPITTLDQKENLLAITRIYTTLNTTGKKLTPIEIVKACLYAHDIDLSNEIETYHGASHYLDIIDPIGEMLLQTIALLANKSPKKSLFPKTITFDIFKKNYDKALDQLDQVGKFLTDDLNLGLDQTKELLPYDSIIAPMAVVFSKTTLNKKSKEKITHWLIGSALNQRYQEGVHNKQSSDVNDMIEWIKEDDDALKPKWLSNTRIPVSIKNASPTGALGKLVKVLISMGESIDIKTGTKIGFYSGAKEIPKEMFCWDKRFCEQKIKGWGEADKHNLIFNQYSVSLDTKKQLNNKDHTSLAKMLKNDPKAAEKMFFSEECVKLLSKDKIEKIDFEKLINARFQIVIDKLKEFGFSLSKEDDIS